MNTLNSAENVPTMDADPNRKVRAATGSPSKDPDEAGSEPEVNPNVRTEPGPRQEERPVEPPDVDAPTGRRYRSAPVRTVDLPSSFIEDAGGAFTRKGTPRLDVLAAARAAFLQRKADDADSDALKFDSRVYAARHEGEHIKSLQGHAEDVWRRVYKCPIPEGDPLDDEEFRQFYDRTRRALKRSDLLEDRGPAVPDPSKLVRDAHGKRWSLSDGLREAESGRETADPPPFVRCTGPEPEGDSADVWTRIERRVAREESLHREFTHAVTASELDGPRWESKARRWERRYLRDGSDSPRYRTVGQWRPEAASRSDRHEQAVRVPWIVAEIDGRDDRGRKDRATSDRLARRLLRRLDAFGVDLSDVVVSYSGNASIHVRIPDGAVGCPIYRAARAAREAIGWFFDRLCGPVDSLWSNLEDSALQADPELRTAIDDACFRPGQLIRAIGSTHEATGRQTVGTTADIFLEKPATFLWTLSEPQFEYTPPESFPLPRRAAFCAPLASLLKPTSKPSSDREAENECSTEYVPPEGDGGPGSVMDRVQSGVREGEPWGSDVGRPEVVGRNWAALFVCHDVIRRTGGLKKAWRAVKHWNRYNDPPLSEAELRTVFEKACRYQRGMTQGGGTGR